MPTSSKKKEYSPQDLGRLFEGEFSKDVGGRLQINSGAVWYSKLDVSDNKFLWSCKRTNNKSFSLKQADIKEVVDAVEGPGGEGIETIPAIAIRIGSPEYDMVALRKEDFLRLMTQEVKYIEPSKHEAKRQRSQIPKLMRGEDD